MGMVNSFHQMNMICCQYSEYLILEIHFMCAVHIYRPPPAPNELWMQATDIYCLGLVFWEVCRRTPHSNEKKVPEQSLSAAYPTLSQWISHQKNQDNTTRSIIIYSTVGGRTSATFPQLGSSRPKPPRYVPGGHVHILIPHVHMVDIYQDSSSFSARNIWDVSL